MINGKLKIKAEKLFSAVDYRKGNNWIELKSGTELSIVIGRSGATDIIGNGQFSKDQFDLIQDIRYFAMSQDSISLPKSEQIRQLFPHMNNLKERYRDVVHGRGYLVSVSNQFLINQGNDWLQAIIDHLDAGDS